MIDTRGMAVRSGILDTEFVNLQAGDTFRLFGRSRQGDAAGVSVSCPALVDEVKAGARVLPR